MGKYIVLCVDCHNARALPRERVCQPCKTARQRSAQLWIHYGMTDREYDEMVRAQRGVCAICGKSDEVKLQIDHDHVTGEVRGLLCRGCNWGLGHFGDSVELLLKAAQYLLNGGRNG